MEKEMRLTCDNQHWAHVLVRIAVAIIVFWCGVQFGELKAMLRNNFDSGRVMSSYNMQSRAVPNMMYSYSAPVPASATTVAPAAVVAPAKK